MTSREDVQAYLDRLDLPVELVATDMWRVKTPEDAELVVHYAPPVLVLRVRVMPLPSDATKSAELCRRLLEYNAHDLVHGSYGIEGDHVVLTFGSVRRVAALGSKSRDTRVIGSGPKAGESFDVTVPSHVSALAPFGER